MILVQDTEPPIPPQRLGSNETAWIASCLVHQTQQKRANGPGPRFIWGDALDRDIRLRKSLLPNEEYTL